MGFSLINHPFGGTTIYGNPHIQEQNSDCPQETQLPAREIMKKSGPRDFSKESIQREFIGNHPDRISSFYPDYATK